MPKTKIVSQHVETPIGKLLLLATEQGLLKVGFESEDESRVIEDVSVFFGSEVMASIGELAPVARQFEEYFTGIRHNFDVNIDRSLSAGFRRSIHEQISTVPYGQTATYKDLALGVNNVGAVRAVGTACGANPLPVVVPCHRILRTDGTLGGYAGGLEVKKTLLSLEQSFA